MDERSASRATCTISRHDDRSVPILVLARPQLLTRV